MADVSPMCRAVLTGGCLLFLFGSIINGRSAPAPTGPVEELTVLESFGANSQNAWVTSAGGNISYRTAFGRNIPGVVDSALQVEFTRKNPTETSAGQNWFSMKRPITPGSVPKDANGLRLLLGSTAGGEWWMRVNLKVGNETYSRAIQPTLPTRTTTEHVLPWPDFTCEGHTLTPQKALELEEVGLELSANGPSLYLEKITTYRQQVYDSWLTFESCHPSNNLFEAGQRVEASLKTGGTVPVEAKGFRYEVSDFFERPVLQGRIKLTKSGNYTLELTPAKPGYYELRTYWVSENGKDLEPRSCLLAEGTMPSGLATFAVLPRTVSENIARFKAMGTNAFFGLHGDFMGLADLMGLCWRLDYTRWPFLEPSKPDRSHGMAAWATDIIRNQASNPDYQPAILPLCGNFAPADWAKSKSALAPPYTSWDDYLSMLSDYVTVKKHLYPHMRPRIYGAAWEINLNMPPSNFWPAYSPADIVELHRRTRETIKAADPDAMILGPCPSNLNTDWFEQVFRAGLLEYVDGIEAHGYAEGAFSPEQNDYPEKLSKLKELMRRYRHGRVLPVYITEAAFRGMLGSKIIYRTQAQVMTRLAIILKGEGVRVFLPFYGIDYDRDGWWGFCFNLEVDGNPWATRRISPKPTVCALANCADLLEGASPVRRLDSLGKDVWAYLFQRNGTGILAVWEPNRERRIHLRVGAAAKVQVVDIMGHGSWVPVENGGLDLTIGPSPVYLTGLGLDSE